MVEQVPSGMTVLEAIAELRGKGFASDFSVAGDGLRCGDCGHEHPVASVEMVTSLRVEGVSDPADEAIVIGLRCTACRVAGVIVAGYGPTADPVEAAVIKRIAP